MAIPAWVEWRREAEDFVAEGEAVPMLEEALANDVDEGTLPSSMLRHTLHKTRHDSNV